MSGQSCFNIYLDKTFGISYFSECLVIELWYQRCHSFPYFTGLYHPTFLCYFSPKLVSAQLLLDSFSTKLRIQTELGLYLFLLHFVSWKYYNYGIYRTILYSTIAISTIVYSIITRLSKDNGPASKEPNETHNECMLHFHKFHKVL